MATISLDPSDLHQTLSQDHIDNSAAIVSDDPEEIIKEYDTFRTQCPLAYTTRYNGYWLMTRYADVKAAALDPATFISSVRAVIPSDPRGLRRPPLNFDAPAHTPYRTALDRTLKPARLARLRPALERHAADILAPLLARGTMDASSDFAAHFAARVEAEWLNLEPEAAPRLAETAAAWVNAWRDMDAERTTRHSQRLYDLARELLADRRLHPRDPELDPASSLLLERDSKGAPLEEVHLVGCVRQSLVVGMVAPPIMVGGICAHLARDQALQQRLREDPSLIPAAVEEFVRLYSPYRGFARTVSRDVELHGQTIKPGTPVTLTYCAANRDAEVFENPNDFVLDRPNIAMHMGFGRGRHRCVGQPLAKLALQISLRCILEKTRSFYLDGALKYARMPEMGTISCPLRLVLV